jgi:hypothetical protein
MTVILIEGVWAGTMMSVFSGADTTSWAVFAFLAGSVGNTSVLVFFAFASRYRPIYTSALSVGYGLSGAAGFALSLLQNASHPHNLRFSIPVYFGMAVLLVFCLGGLAGLILSLSPWAKKYWLSPEYLEALAAERSTSAMEVGDDRGPEDIARLLLDQEEEEEAEAVAKRHSSISSSQKRHDSNSGSKHNSRKRSTSGHQQRYATAPPTF